MLPFPSMQQYLPCDSCLTGHRVLGNQSVSEPIRFAPFMIAIVWYDLDLSVVPNTTVPSRWFVLILRAAVVNRCPTAQSTWGRLFEAPFVMSANIWWWKYQTDGKHRRESSSAGMGQIRGDRGTWDNYGSIQAGGRPATTCVEWGVDDPAYTCTANA